MIEITDQPIDVQKVIAAASNNGAGAINVFIGTVREIDNNKKVLLLEYEAYKPMAISETQKIMDEAVTRWEVIGWAISHRIGILKPGETAVAVAISTRHRKQSFEACQFVIDSLKKTVPIFKKEVFEDSEEWVDAKTQSAPTDTHP